MNSPTEGERLDPIDVLMDDFLQQTRSGQRPSVEGFCRENPELSDAIERLFPMLNWLEKAAQRPAETLHLPSKSGSD